MLDWPSRISAWPVCSQGGHSDFFRSQGSVVSSEGLYRFQETLELLAQFLRWVVYRCRRRGREQERQVRLLYTTPPSRLKSKWGRHAFFWETGQRYEKAKMSQITNQLSREKNLGWSIMIFFFLLSFLSDRPGRYSKDWTVDLESIHIANRSEHVQLCPFPSPSSL